ncbi:MAG: EAL domain-containing protein [Thermoanaerobaculia bacterium]|nr:EAL domain-containing protein [Thermoanaerobaculia bacterium]
MKPPGASPPTAEPQEWFRALAETTSTAIFLFRDRFLYVNRGWREVSGYSAAELAQMSLWELVHPRHHDLLGDRWDEARPGRRLELQIVRKDGETRWLDLAISQLRLDDGRRAAAGTGFDITERKLAELSALEVDSRLKLAQRAAQSVAWEWVPETDELRISDYADEIFGFAVRRIIRTGANFRRFVHPDDQQRLERALRRALARDGSLAVEIRCVLPNGSIRWIAEKGLAVRNAEGWTTKVIGAAHDVTERKIAEEALFQEKERAQVTLASIADGVIRTDAEGSIDYLNPVAQRLTGWTLAEAYGRPVDEVYKVVSEDTGQQSLDPVRRCLSERQSIVYPGDRSLVRRDGKRFAVHDSAAPIRSRDGSLIGAILVFKDLSALRRVQRQIAHLATHDPLTGLINRREFEARLAEALESAQTEERVHALAHLDLDRFKVINDANGPSAGDQLIRQVAALIPPCLEEHDLVARLVGDDFGVLLWDREPEAARATVQRVLDRVAEHRFSWQGRVYPLSFSAGLVPLTAESRDLSSVVSAADAACYVAREQGGNRIHAYQPGDTTVAEHHGQMQWITRLHTAFDEDRLTIFRQRIVPLADGEEEPLHELLVRLVEPSGEIVEPHAFVPAAEKYGMISSIDRWMVGSALEHLAGRSGRPPRPDQRFGINVSGQSLSESEFLDFVVESLETSGVEPARIQFEITETAAIADLPNAIRFISVLKGRGCRFVLDDFGKGLSSFSYLQNLPVDYLKIDGEFVRNMVADPVQAALVTSIHEVGQVLGLLTIAEAVEDQATLEALRELGVNYAQGRFLSPPEPLATGRLPRVSTGR